MATVLAAEKDCEFGKDRISGVPDDIILSILDCMGMKEAAKSSILSKRWRYLWAERTHMDFDHFLLLPDTKPNIEGCSFTVAQKDKYINSVNQVVALHCSPYINTFRVCFPGSDAHQFEKWVKFALLRKVKNLELYSSFRHQVVYTLGFDILKPSMGGITSLTSLHLHRVDVAGDFIEFLLSNCHNLERLYVGFSSLLVKLKVIGLSCKLKQLTVRSCRELEDLVIDAPNLMYLDYVAKSQANLVLRRMPMLVEAAFGGTCFSSRVTTFPKISPLAAHIYRLSLDMKFYRFPGGALPLFSNLKHLNVVVEWRRLDPANITPLLEACPVLHELKLQIHWGIYNVELEYSLLEELLQHTGSALELYFDRTLRQTKGKTHPNLKLLEIVAYSGCACDVEMILYLLRFACNLETIICDPSRSTLCFSHGYTIERTRARAYKLKKIIPPKINVIII